LIWAKVNAAIEATIKVSATVSVEMISELRKSCQ
jgi:hypothetical protein